VTLAPSRTALQIRPLIRPDGELELSLADVPVPLHGPYEVVVRVEALPLNPSDMGLLFGAADMRTAKSSGTASRQVVTARVPETALKAVAGRSVSRCRWETRAPGSLSKPALRLIVQRQFEMPDGGCLLR
jgi:NADPH:quinone reductase